MNSDTTATRAHRSARFRADSLARAFRVVLMIAGVIAVQSAHGIARGDADPVPADPPAPPSLPYPEVSPIVGAERAGNLQGSSAVTPGGSYSYLLPIDVPPGRAGVQPSLALSYDSGTGDGHLGVGFSLLGLSEIRRCHKTWATEGWSDGIDFNHGDAFCLDGQKLRQINASLKQNGEEGAEYRTERDTFSRIVTHGDSGRGPSRFTLQRRNGDVLEYATVVESRRFQGGLPEDPPMPDPSSEENTVRAVWLLTEMRDSSGNAVLFDYDILEDPNTFGVEYRIHAIRYTAKHLLDGGEPTEPTGDHRRVEFDYLPRSQDARIFRYESGVRWETNSLLSTITMFGPDPVDTSSLGQVRLKYGASPDTGRPLLQSVRRCEGQGPYATCLRAKMFSYWERTAPGQPLIQFEDVPVTPVSLGAADFPDAVMVGDFNGDGLDDLLYRAISYGQGGYEDIFLRFAQKDAQGTSSFSPPIWANALGTEFSDTDIKRSRPADIDGDGRAEIVAAVDPLLDETNPMYPPVSGYQIFRWSDATAAFLPVGPYLEGDLGLDVIQLTDFDGDGRIDIFRERPDLGQGSGAADLGRWELLRNDPLPNNAYHFAAPEVSDALSVQGQYARAMDVDGDGRGDLLPIDWDTVQDGTDDVGLIPGATLKLGLNDVGDVTVDTKWRLRSFARMELVDLNGDGLRDALYPLGAQTQVRWNMGNGFGPLQSIPSSIVPVSDAAMSADMGLRAADVDGDGREDLISFEGGDDESTDPHMRLHRLRGSQLIEDLLAPAGSVPYQRDSGAIQEGWPYCALGDFNGDALADIVHLYQSGEESQLVASIQNFVPSDVLFEVSDEDAPTATETVFYDRPSPDPGTSCTWPQICVRRAMEGVSLTLTESGGELTQPRGRQYSYHDARMDLQGRGFLGFAEIDVYDDFLHSYTKSTFDNVTRVILPTGGAIYPYVGLPKTIQHLTPIFDTPVDGSKPTLDSKSLLGRVVSITNTYNENTANDPDALWSIAGSGTYVVHPVGSVVVEGETQLLVSPSHAIVEIVGPPDPNAREVNSGILYDDYENAVSTHVITNGWAYRWTTATYENRVADWILGLPLLVETAAGEAGQPADPRVVEYDFDSKGRLHWEKIEPNGTDDLRRTTVYFRDGAGLPYEIQHQVPNEPIRKSFVAYDEMEGMFPRAVWNSLGHYQRVAYHPGYGLPVVSEDANGVQIRRTFDRLGRLRSVDPDGGTAAEISYTSLECLTSAAEKGVCLSVTFEDGGQQVQYADEYGRAWEMGERGFDGALVFQRQRYNALGQPVQSTRPFTTFEQGVTTSTFDSLGRPRLIRAPDSTTTTLAYQGLYASSAIDANGHEVSMTRDALGRIAEVRDTAVMPTTYTYAAFDLITTIRDPLGNVTQLDYDKLGRRTLLVDPDQGTTTFHYNGFGELQLLEHHSDDPLVGNDLETEYHRDLLGRVSRRLDTIRKKDDPNDNVVITTLEVTEVEYDTSPNGLGKVAHTVSPDGVETTHHYDTYGRPSVMGWTIDGTVYSFTHHYDAATGKPSGLDYPSGGEAFELGFDYNTFGWLMAVFRPTSPVSASLWEVKSRNLDGMLTAAAWVAPDVTEARTYSPMTGRLHNIEVKGSDVLADLTYGYDLVGNVTDRWDDVAVRTESFAYDDADRLIEWTLEPHAQATRKETYSYDDLGNLLGIFVDGLLTEVHAIDPVRPHQLGSISYPKDGTSRSYTADERGRQVADSDGRELTYTPFDLPRIIHEPSTFAAPNGEDVQFAYDAFGQRVKKTITRDSVVSSTITLGSYERREVVDSAATVVTHVFYVPGEEGPSGQVVFDETTGEETITYLAKDGLGSTAVVFDEKGHEVERLFHEPFGRRIESAGLALKSFESKASVSLGFTGHRHDDDLGLIDMRGRVYDPVQRRFLTPDPFVNDPFDGQSYNRYAYVRNSPLVYTDPSGFQESKPTYGGPLFDWIFSRIVKALYSAPPKDAPPPPPPPDTKGGSSDGKGATPPASGTTPPREASPEPEFVPYNPTAQRVGGFCCGALISGVPFGGIIVAGVLQRTPGTPEAREGLSAGMAAGGILWTLGGLNKQVTAPAPTAPPQMLPPTPVPAGSGPAPSLAPAMPVVVAPAGAGILAIAGLLTNVAVGLDQVGQSLSTGGGDDGEASTPTARGATELLGSANQVFRNGPLSAAGRALTKHPNVIGESGNLLQKLGGAANVNSAASKAVENILKNGTMVTKTTKAFGDVIEYTLASGLGARWSATTGEFIGFLGRGL